MKRNGILHPQLNALIAELGHTDTLVVADCGLPIPAGVARVDLALVPGLPRFAAVLEALASELVVQKVTVAEEMAEHNGELAALVQGQFEGVPLERVPHEELKARLTQAKGVVRTGEATPFANAILECGVAF